VDRARSARYATPNERRFSLEYGQLACEDDGRSIAMLMPRVEGQAGLQSTRQRAVARSDPAFGLVFNLSRVHEDSEI